MTTIAILGGYGKAGKAIARHLARETDCRILIVGRNGQHAKEFADELNANQPTERAQALEVELHSEEALYKTFRQCDIALICMRTTGFVESVVRAAVGTKTALLDITLNPSEIQDVCDKWEREIHQQGCCFITDAGILPGMPSALVAYAATKLTNMKKAAVGEVMRVDAWSVEAIAGFLEDLQNISGGSAVYQKDDWQRPRGSGKRMMDFGSPFGVQKCYPYLITELKALPERFHLEELGMYSASFGHGVIDTLFMFIFLLKIGRGGRGVKSAARVLDWAFRKFGKPPYGFRMKLEAESSDGERLELILSHDDMYEATAIPVVACLLQWLDGSIKKPGVWMMGHVVEPVRLMADIERLGMSVEIR